MVQGAPAGGVLLRVLHRSGGLLRREILGGTQEAIRARYKEMEENSKDLTRRTRI
ncbi:MAG: hypothetical protein ACLS7Z_02210 [Christensenellales bacterium]